MREHMKFIDWFAGIGGFRRGMELAGHECVGFCEFDKYAVMSYTSMHLITEKQREYLKTLPLKERQKEILKSEYRNGEWYADDIRYVDAKRIPKSGCWCFGFPCQDISIAGEKKGFEGNRSSLFFRVMHLIGQLSERDRPKYLFIENVRNLLSIHEGWDFARVLIELDRGGYDAEWQVVDSKYFVPQHRERVFIVGTFRGRDSNEDVFARSKYQGSDGEDTKVCTNTIVRRYPGNVNGTFIQDDVGIRPLTPKECFRLQGWTDDYFEKAEMVNSNSQLYKQAGNGVTVSVIYEIAKRMT